MIGKLRKGQSFIGLARYLTHDGRGQVLALDNLSSDNVPEAAQEMTVAAATSRRTQKPVLHLCLSYSDSEFITTDQMRDDARRVLRALGLKEHQAVIVAHDDTSHPHIHVMASRVGPDSRTASDSQSFARVESVLRKIETERGWSSVPGRNASSPTTGRRVSGQRISRDPRQHHVPERVRQFLLTAESWVELHKGVRSEGWRLEVVQKGRGSGALLVGPAGECVAAGNVDRQATLTSLRRRLGRDPEARKKRLSDLVRVRKKAPRRAPSTAGQMLAAMRPMLLSGLVPSLRPYKSALRLPGLPRL
ncbi:relaxase/mobilization nuclease domain-containing protein [Roseinatronobacter bogoriensis]|uniref:MobA/VirD2-like nuclease domain-containing protein n=1 Tax=Roseinatronobacter bogoriensis subsp. barguzinensis TaxID=441209 RepID=A0A2K8KBE2_9RHOB|nr:hypothetical protein BG454_04760 [Rhodobaca barguzinensis]MBB4209321.1 hypothetical protein [Rhodobaca bogoriensis DSM 18756]TDW34345.1 relaxase/mobilization nuclease-like protein [Rhodobaca barguzinensis]TDY67064.1 relaxase/mobilization nuclease-like protein [Rhodobaca bogoriensis DSM 18756]